MIKTSIELPSAELMSFSLRHGYNKSFSLVLDIKNLPNHKNGKNITHYLLNFVYF